MNKEISRVIEEKWKEGAISLKNGGKGFKFYSLLDTEGIISISFKSLEEALDCKKQSPVLSIIEITISQEESWTSK